MRAKPRTNMYKSSGRNMGLRPGKRYVRIFCRMNGVKCSATHRALRSSPYVRLVDMDVPVMTPTSGASTIGSPAKLVPLLLPYKRARTHAKETRTRNDKYKGRANGWAAEFPIKEQEEAAGRQTERERDNGCLFRGMPGGLQVRISSRVLVSPRICVFPHHIKH